MARARRTEDPVDMVTLTLNMAEAKVLVAITDRIGGNPTHSVRGLTDSIGCALRNVGVYAQESFIDDLFERCNIYMQSDSIQCFDAESRAEV